MTIGPLPGSTVEPRKIGEVYPCQSVGCVLRALGFSMETEKPAQLGVHPAQPGMSDGSQVAASHTAPNLTVPARGCLYRLLVAQPLPVFSVVKTREEMTGPGKEDPGRRDYCIVSTVFRCFRRVRDGS
mgnify:FL=1